MWQWPKWSILFHVRENIVGKGILRRKLIMIKLKVIEKRHASPYISMVT